MTDTLARMRNLIGSTAEWAANDLTIAPGELALETRPSGGPRIKIGDGVRPFSGLPYSASGAAADVLSVYDYAANDAGSTDETAALNRFFADAAAAGKVADLGDQGTFLFTKLVIPANTMMRGRANLRCTGTLSTFADVSVVVTAPFVAEALHIVTPGTDSNNDLLRIDGDFVRIGELVLHSEVERAGLGGAIITGGDVRIGTFKSRRVARPLQFQRVSGTAVQANIALGIVDIAGYIRGLAFTNCEQFSVDRFLIRSRDSRAALSPGHNGILVQACRYWAIGDGRIEDAAEHALRIGGAPAGWTGNTTDFVIGELHVLRSGGCALKMNPSDGERILRGKVGAVLAVDVGQGSTSGNVEVVRLTRTTDVDIETVDCTADAYAASCKCAVTVNDIARVRIGRVFAPNCSGRLVQVDETQDEGAAGNVTGFYIDRIVGSMAAGTLAAFSIVYSSGGRTIGDVVWQGIDVTGFTTRLLDATAGLTLSGPIELRGVARGAVAPTTNVQTDARIRYAMQWDTVTYAGRAATFTGSYGQAVEAPAFDPAAGVGTTWGTFHAVAPTGVPAAGAYGGAYSFSRVGTTRRGAAIAAKQTGADEKKVSLAFFVQSVASTANEVVIERMILKDTGVLYFSAPAVFADNTTAKAGGLVVGDLYRTATGEARIVV